MLFDTEPWIGVDFDGTLAHFEEWVAPTSLGKPIPLMVNRVKVWLAEGKRVKIMTARIAHHEHSDAVIEDVKAAIQDWCVEHIGQELEVVCHKDTMLVALWDDRAVRIVRNTGELHKGWG